MITIIQSRCINCGLCEKVSPEGFKIEKNTILVKDSNALGIEEAIHSCPVQAIIKEDSK